MTRWAVIIVCGLGWLVLAGGVAAPLVGAVWAGTEPGRISTDLVGVPPWWALLGRSLALSATATGGAVGLGLLPALILGSCRGRFMPLVLGLVLAPLLIPPQVHAYAWELVIATGLFDRLLTPERALMPIVAAYRSGKISVRWLWPVSALIVAAGWRSTGRTAYTLAVLDTTPIRAQARAVLPSLRSYLLTAAGCVFAITLLEYGIPHLLSARVYATQLMVLCDVGAPGGQVMGMAAQTIAILAVLIGILACGVRGLRSWQPVETDDVTNAPSGSLKWAAGRTALRSSILIGGAVVLLITVAVPAGVMLASLRDAGAWRQAFILLGDQWGWSLAVSLTAALMAVALAVGTAALRSVTSRPWLRIATGVAVLASAAAVVMPPAALGIGFVTIYNGLGIVRPLYQDTPVVWSLALAGRYGAIAILITWLALDRRGIVAAEQARTDGADEIDVLVNVSLPMVWPALAAAGLIVAALSMFEVVVTHLVAPVGFPSIALTLLGQMHWGRDDVVITTSLVVVAAGIVTTQICGWLLARPEK